MNRLSKYLFLFPFFIIGFSPCFAQGPEVPSTIEFADLTLKISESAKKTIQADVDALYRSEKYFKMKLERVDLYFPIIERVLKEESVPEDFKFLVIQESSLVSDAVSSSNAVGFWQFKQDAGEEVGLSINAQVDERMNIVASTHGAAKYLAKHNSYFDNWVYSLLGYYLGRGGAKSLADPALFGSKKMTIDNKTNWYILKFLAHKIAFENATGKNPSPALVLAEYANGAEKSLKEISQETETDLELLEQYNKWLKKGKIPSDKNYVVLIPTIPSQDDLFASAEVPEAKSRTLPGETANSRFKSDYPKIEGDLDNPSGPLLVTINARPGIVSREGDDISSLASAAGVKEGRFVKFNDIKPGHKVKPGQFYYLKRKKNNAPVHYHTVQHGETLWEISQMYGIKEASIRRKNRMSRSGSIKPGMVLWMRYIRPSNEAVAYREVGDSEHQSPQKKVQAKSSKLKSTAQDPVIDKKEEQKLIAKKLEAEPVFKEQEEAVPFVDTVAVTDTAQDSSTISDADNEAKKPGRRVIDIRETSSEPPVVEENTNEQVVTPDPPRVEEPEIEKNIDLDDTTKIKKQVPIDTLSSKKVEPTKEDVSAEQIKKDPELINEQEKKEEVKDDQIKEEDEFDSNPVKFVDPENTTQASEEQKEQHVVQQGESLYGIAKKYGIPIKDLADWNKLKYNEGIKIGQVLSLKSPEIISAKNDADVRKPMENTQEEFILHKVVAGETLYKIARDHNVTIKEVMEWNNKKNFNVSLGDVIKIKKLIGIE